MTIVKCLGYVTQLLTSSLSLSLSLFCCEFKALSYLAKKLGFDRKFVFREERNDMVSVSSRVYYQCTFEILGNCRVNFFPRFREFFILPLRFPLPDIYCMTYPVPFTLLFLSLLQLLKGLQLRSVTRRCIRSNPNSLREGNMLPLL